MHGKACNNNNVDLKEVIIQNCTYIKSYSANINANTVYILFPKCQRKIKSHCVLNVRRFL